MWGDAHVRKGFHGGTRKNGLMSASCRKSWLVGDQSYQKIGKSNIHTADRSIEYLPKRRERHERFPKANLGDGANQNGRNHCES